MDGLFGRSRVVYVGRSLDLVICWPSSVTGELTSISSALKIELRPHLFSPQNTLPAGEKQKKRDLSWNRSDGFSQHCRGIHLLLHFKYDGGSKPN